MSSSRVYLPDDVRMHVKYAFHSNLSSTPPHVTVTGFFDMDPILVSYHGRAILEAAPDENQAIQVIHPHVGFHPVNVMFRPAHWYITGIDSLLKLELKLAFNVHELTTSMIKMNFQIAHLMLRDRSGDRLFNTNDQSELYEIHRSSASPRGFDIVKEYSFDYNVRIH